MGKPRRRIVGGNGLDGQTNGLLKGVVGAGAQPPQEIGREGQCCGRSDRESAKEGAASSHGEESSC
ncbi:MAG: hypothetical protein ABI068_08320 [Ktedonobacterales bacterium]